MARRTDFLDALADGPALYVLRHTGQPPAPNEMRFDFELANGNTGTVNVSGAGDLTAAAQGNLFAPEQGSGCRRRPAASLTTPPTTRCALLTGAERGRRRPWFEPSRLPTTSGTLLCTDLNRWFAQRPPGIPLKRWHTGNRVEPLVDGLETFARLWDDSSRSARQRPARPESRATARSSVSG